MAIMFIDHLALPAIEKEKEQKDINVKDATLFLKILYN
jgi:hypothetical protein